MQEMAVEAARICAQRVSEAQMGGTFIGAIIGILVGIGIGWNVRYSQEKKE